MQYILVLMSFIFICMVNVNQKHHSNSTTVRWLCGTTKHPHAILFPRGATANDLIKLRQLKLIKPFIESA